MSEMDEYFTTLTPAQLAEFERIRSIVRRIVPSVEEGTSYAMPAYMYKGKPLLSVMAAKKHFSLYPFSGKVLDKLRDKLEGFEISAGSGAVHFSEEKMIPEALLKEIILTRIEEIDGQ
jgi:uncharacterized protein YdhG (YjbR/CyaY superfamily)